MIAIKALEEKDKLLPLCQTCGVKAQEADGAYVMTQGEAVLGACFYRLEEAGAGEEGKLLSVARLWQPQWDPLMFDGLVRAVFSFAMGRGAYRAKFLSQEDQSAFFRIYPQMDHQKTTIEIENFFTICTNCKE